MNTNNYREQLNALGVPYAAVAHVAGIQPQEFSRFLRDPGLLVEPKRLAAEKAFQDLCELQEAAKNEFPPAVVINWKNVQAVKELVTWFRAQVFLAQLETAQQVNSSLARLIHER